MLKKIVFMCGTLFLSLSLLASPANAWQPDEEPNLQRCAYGSTQSRVKRVGHQPWEENLYLTCGEPFEVGGFHDQTGQYAHDIRIRVNGPDFNSNVRDGQPIQNGDRFYTTIMRGMNYKYEVKVRTKGMETTDDCVDYSYVHVYCPWPNQTNRPTPTPRPTPTYRPIPTYTPTPRPTVIPVPSVQPTYRPTPTPSTNPGQCQYQSTQARVKHDSSQGYKNQNWYQTLYVDCFESFEVGSFHNGTGEYAHDTNIQVVGPLLNYDRYQNGDRIHAVWPGDYNVYVTTRGQSGPACQDMATVKVTCNWPWQER